MTVFVHLEAHAFAEEKLCDQDFDNPPHYGIIGPEVMLPLAQSRGRTIEVKYDEKTTLKEFRAILNEEIWGRQLDNDVTDPIMSFLISEERYYVDNPEAKLSPVLEKHIDKHRTGHITVCFLVCCDAGRIEPKSGPLRYEIHSREACSHHEPHVHVEDAGHKFKAVVSITSGTVLAGTLGKYESSARKVILENQPYYYHCWNTLSDGIKVDINHHYQLINY